MLLHRNFLFLPQGVLLLVDSDQWVLSSIFRYRPSIGDSLDEIESLHFLFDIELLQVYTIPLLKVLLVHFILRDVLALAELLFSEVLLVIVFDKALVVLFTELSWTVKTRASI